MTFYKTNQFAKLANVTDRTIRYYDKIGLLKPSFIMSNGYRQYTDEDLLKLQKIISLKELGLSIQEIFPLVKNEENIKDSLVLQSRLLDSKISQLEQMKETLTSVIESIDSGDMDWKKVISLLQVTNQDSNIIEHYRNSNHLKVRINLHDKYSTNTQGWYPWILEQIDFGRISRLLEIGCGNGQIWNSCKIDLRNREVFLSDISKGMVEEVRNSLGVDFNCIVADCQKIPFKNDYFDAILANHVLFYVLDLSLGLQEISRVLRKGGFLYCTTYGENHMKEINEIVQSFDQRIKLSSHHLYETFGLENGEEILKEYFTEVKRIDYEDSLVITESKPLIDYIMSCHGNQNEILGPRLGEFKDYLNELIHEKGSIKIRKQAGMFKCKK